MTPSLDDAMALKDASNKQGRKIGREVLCQNGSLGVILTDCKHGVEVKSIRDNSTLKSRVALGDILVSINGESMSNWKAKAAAEKLVALSDDVRLLVFKTNPDGKPSAPPSDLLEVSSFTSPDGDGRTGHFEGVAKTIGNAPRGTIEDEHVKPAPKEGAVNSRGTESERIPSLSLATRPEATRSEETSPRFETLSARQRRLIEGDDDDAENDDDVDPEFQFG